jgi:hypothetical protein
MVLDQEQEGSARGSDLPPWSTICVGAALHENVAAASGDAKKSNQSRMLYQNARLYDEWKGDTTVRAVAARWRACTNTGCKGGILAIHGWEKPGRARPGWDEDAPLTPTRSAYYRIDGRSLVDMQSAISETHAIYVSASVHDGRDRIKKAKRLEDAVIGPPRTDDFGGHAFAIVGYTAEGFIVQNSWGPDWGFHGFALLPYEDWTKNGTDAWGLALGAPMRISLGEPAKKKKGSKSGIFRSPSARTEISLDERMRLRGRCAPARMPT